MTDMQILYLILLLIIFFIGVALAFLGRNIWGGLMSIIGSMIGWYIGFAIGVYFIDPVDLGGWLIVIIIAFICSFIMSIIFRYLVEVALALITGALVGGVALLLTESEIVGIIVFAVAFVLAYIFIESIIILVTALIGALLAGGAVYFMSNIGNFNGLDGFEGNLGLAILAFALVFIGGLLVQIIRERDDDRRYREAKRRGRPRNGNYR
jgi:hypothetical protein